MQQKQKQEMTKGKLKVSLSGCDNSTSLFFAATQTPKDMLLRFIPTKSWTNISSFCSKWSHSLKRHPHIQSISTPFFISCPVKSALSHFLPLSHHVPVTPTSEAVSPIRALTSYSYYHMNHRETTYDTTMREDVYFTLLISQRTPQEE